MMYEASQDEKTYTDPSPWPETSLIRITRKQGHRTLGFAGTRHVTRSQISQPGDIHPSQAVRITSSHMLADDKGTSPSGW